MEKEIKTNRLILKYNNACTILDEYLIFLNDKNIGHIAQIQDEMQRFPGPRCIELDFMIFDDFKKKSYMTEALDAYLKEFFTKYRNLIVRDEVDKNNIISKEFHEKFGFEIEVRSDEYNKKVNRYVIDKECFEATAQKRDCAIDEACNPNILFTVADEFFKKSFLFKFNI